MCYTLAMQKLPIGIQFFDDLRKSGCLYVDKTEQIHTLMQTGKFIFLSRPRRFGKSLLVSTLQHIFQGDKELFTGLWIEDKIDWQPRPVLAINFNDVDYLSKNLGQGLEDLLDKLAYRNNLALTATGYKNKFQELIERLSEKQPPVLLVDEYDKAITDLLESEQKVTEHVAILKGFYSVIKATEAHCIHWALFTGVSKYGKLSLFSDLNNLTDITMDARFATLVGYTQTELEAYFPEYIDRLTVKFQASRAEVLQAIQHWYNGYSWDGVQTVYVPFSTLLFFELQTFENHWFSTGSPSFLFKLLRQNQMPAYLLEKLSGDNTLLDSADVNNINVISLLFQTGYLTIKKVYPALSGTTYDLGYPNHEVTQSFQRYLLVDYLKRESSYLSTRLISGLKEALEAQNLPGFIEILKAVFAGIPHTLFLPDEAYYHSVIYLVLKLLGFSILAEPLTNQGRLDALLELPDKIYILEYKMSSATAALNQIKKKQYDQPYRASGKQIILLGIAFDKEKRTIRQWKSEPKP